MPGRQLTVWPIHAFIDKDDPVVMIIVVRVVPQVRAPTYIVIVDFNVVHQCVGGTIGYRVLGKR